MMTPFLPVSSPSSSQPASFHPPLPPPVFLANPRHLINFSVYFLKESLKKQQKKHVTILPKKLTIIPTIKYIISVQRSLVVSEIF